MPLKFKKNLLMKTTFLFLGYAHVLHADECGVLRYLANKSNGVEIFGNKCTSIDGIALGSVFNLMPGARLWFKSQMDTDAIKTQGICQNRSSKPIHIRVDSNKSPWIKPIGLNNCSSWESNTMNCKDNKESQMMLSCVIAAAASRALSRSPEESTTSVRIRSLTELNAPDKTDNKQIVPAMQPEINLCRAINPTDAQINITWQVESNGRVVKVDVSGAQSDVEKQLVSYLTAVIKDFAYPQTSQVIWLSNQF